jgi:cyclophilin family peptidyl-prolyl cis-trans isomerase
MSPIDKELFMNFFRRFTPAAALILIVTLAAGSASAWAGAPVPLTAATGTPDEICATATADLEEPETRQFEQAGDVLQGGVDYWAVICTDAGAIFLDLYEDKAPITVNNFVFLAQQGYYNHTTFHRVLPGFMAQAGDPTGTGGGGPGYEFEDETDNGLAFDQFGLLAMANAGANTNGSQFFITYALTPWLDGNHTIFGHVFQGIDVAERLTLRDPEGNPGYEGAALHTVVIVEDRDSVDATPDSPPSLDHFQFLLEQNIAGRLTNLFTLVEDYSHVYDLQAEAQSWQDDGGDELVSFLWAYLSDSGFIGTAAILTQVNTCSENPADLPVWLVGFQVSDYGTADAAQAVVFDNTRADKLVSTGAYEAYVDPADVQGRLFSLALPAEGWCKANGVYYRLEVPYGRYLLSTDLVLDGDVINDQAEPTPAQYLGFVTEDLLLGTIGSVLDRGNATE